MIPVKTMEETERRYRARERERAAMGRAIEAGDALRAEDPERIRRRVERLASKATLAAAMDPGALIGFERLIGTNDLIGAEFLAKGVVVARSVCRVQIGGRSGVLTGYGTGFLVSPRLLMTNNHVLPDRQTAAGSHAEFDYETPLDGEAVRSVILDLDPGVFFATDPQLDYSLVALSGRAPSAYGWIPLIEAEGKALRGSALNIIQHPDGQLKQVGLRDNRLVDILEQFLHYETDTSPGSSGAPVFNDEWELVALHHSGVPRRDTEGRVLTRDGQPWQEGMDDSLIDWIANEGARVSRIVRHIRQLDLDPAEAPLRDQLLAAGSSPSGAAAQPAVPLGAPAEGASAVTVAGGANSGEGVLRIPLEVVVRVGAPAAAPALAARPEAPPPVTLDEPREVADALAELARARRDPYYDAEADALAREAFYRVDPGAGPEALRRALSELLERTHEPQPAYKPRTHLYPRVDLQPDGRLRSIYTGETYRPEDFILEDARNELERAARLEARLVREADMSDVGRLELLSELEAALPYNCEHVVPQSWFGKREPMRGDLHHLFSCEKDCNSFRGNFPYFDFTDFEEVVRERCGKREDDGFEPNEGKGLAARATLYFLLRYPSELDQGVARVGENWLRSVIAWHQAQPVSDFERHRNATIEARQGNRNPLIDFPEWAGAIDWAFVLPS